MPEEPAVAALFADRRTDVRSLPRRPRERRGRQPSPVGPRHPARSVLEVKARRLLCDHGLGDHVREFPLASEGRRYLYDFASPNARSILETNGRRWHDDPASYEHDHEQWSVPGRLGFRIVFAI